MYIIKRFGEGSREYIFPEDAQIMLTHNFGDLMTKTSKMAFAHGGLDELASGRGLSEVGNVQVEFWLKFEGAADVLEKISALKAMNDWGPQRLFVQPEDMAGYERWCVARVNYNPFSQNVRDLPHTRMKVKMTFHVPDPFWYTKGNQQLWDGSNLWNGAITWDGGSFTTVTGSGTLTVNNPGDAFTLGRVVVQVTGATAFNKLIVRRMVNNGVVDEIKLEREFVQDDIIEIDGRKQWCLLNGDSIFNDLETLQPDWLWLLPGDNTISVKLDQAAAQISVKVLYYERYL